MNHIGLNLYWHTHFEGRTVYQQFCVPQWYYACTCEVQSVKNAKLLCTRCVSQAQNALNKLGWDSALDRYGTHDQWLLSLYLVGAACTQWKMGGSFSKVADQTFPLFSQGKLHPWQNFPLFFNLHP